MSLPPCIKDLLSTYDFSSDILQDPESGATFNFSLELDVNFDAMFSLDDMFGGSSIGSGSLDNNNKSCEFSVEQWCNYSNADVKKKLIQAAHIGKRA
jgi:hypothetical protein